MAETTSFDREEFERLLASHQGRLFGYIRSLLGPGKQGEIADILQATNLILWDKAATFQTGSNFTAWAFKVAKYQVLQQRERWQKEDRRVPFSDDLLETLAIRSEEKEVTFSRRQKYLPHCLEQLPERQMEVIKLRFLEGKPVAEIATLLGLKPNAVSQLLHRSKENLLKCIEGQIGDGRLK